MFINLIANCVEHNIFHRVAEHMPKCDLKRWSRVAHPADLLTEICLLSPALSDYLFHTNNLETSLLEVIYLNHKYSVLLSTWLHGTWDGCGTLLADTIHYKARVKGILTALIPSSCALSDVSCHPTLLGSLCIDSWGVHIDIPTRHFKSLSLFFSILCHVLKPL